MKRILSLVIVLVLLIGVIPANVSAAEGDGSSFAWAVNMTFGNTYTKYWTKYNDHLYHYAKFTTTEKGIVTFKMDKPYDDEGEVCRLKVIVTDENGNYVLGNDGYKAKSNPRSYYQFSFGVEPGTYYISIDPSFYVSSGTIEMDYGVTFKATKYTEIESNEVAASATKMTLGKMYTGFFGADGSDYGENDYWKFETTAGKTYRLTVKNYSQLDSTTAIMKASFDFSSYDLRSQVDADGNNYIEFEASSSGTQYVWLYNYIKEQIEYGIRVDDMTPPTVGKVKNLEATTTSNSVKLTWKKVTDATSYRIWVYDTSAGEWKVLKKTSKNYYTHKDLKKTTTYSYAIQAIQDFFGDEYYGKYSYIDATTKLPDVKNLKATTTTSSVKLSWSKVSGADGYIVYRYNSSTGAYTKLTTTSKTSYTNTGRSAGTSYTYRVRAYKKSGGTTYYSEYAKIKLATKPKNVSGLKATTTDTSVKLSWSKVSGATGYEVYRYNASTGKYVKLKTTTSTSYTNTGRSAGTSYTYRVRAYKTVDGKKYYSNDYTKVKAITKPADVSGFTAESTQTSVKLSWNKAAGATGYEVYRYNASTGKYVKLKTTTSTSYTNTGRSAGTSYTYRIRAYKTVGDTKYYGDYTKLKISTQLKDVTGFVAERTANAINLSWDKVTGAQSYVVSQYDPDTDSWVTVAETAELYANNIAAEAATTYKFRIQAFKNYQDVEYTTNYAELLVTTPPVIVEGLTADTSDGTVLLQWNKVAGATGYVIFRYDTMTAAWAEIGDTADSFYFTQDSENGKVYRYRVCAYIDMGEGGRLTGEKSDIISATIAAEDVPVVTG